MADGNMKFANATASGICQCRTMQPEKWRSRLGAQGLDVPWANAMGESAAKGLDCGLLGSEAAGEICRWPGGSAALSASPKQRFKKWLPYFS